MGFLKYGLAGAFLVLGITGVIELREIRNELIFANCIELAKVGERCEAQGQNAEDVRFLRDHELNNK